ncbi:hypothetical protein FRB93_000004 [Tulasnella sp. JGI-2019a]|nr:hypothetical protein FRB93_000004 [Tulasnella sp. JGI-2019a]
MRLERPISTYSSAELEALVIQMVRLDANWKSDNPKPCRIRQINRMVDLDDILLLPGGRWLLLLNGGSSSRLTVVDLDTPNMDEQILAELGNVSPGEDAGYWGMYANIYERSLMLAWDAIVYKSGSSLHINFMRFTTHNDCKNLLVENLNSLKIQTHQGRMYIPPGRPLQEELVFITGNVLERGRYRCEVIDWRSSTSEIHRKSVFLLGPSSASVVIVFVHILACKERFIVRDGLGISIYHIPPFKMLPAIGQITAWPIMASIWTYVVRPNERAASIPMSILTQPPTQQLRFVVATGQGLLQLVNIPDFNPESILVRSHTPLYPWNAGFLGLRRGFQVSDEATTGSQYWNFMTYAQVDNSNPSAWAVTENVYTPGEEVTRSFDLQYDWQLDEPSGRILIISVAELDGVDDVIQIIDFVQGSWR